MRMWAQLLKEVFWYRKNYSSRNSSKLSRCFNYWANTSQTRETSILLSLILSRPDFRKINMCLNKVRRQRTSTWLQEEAGLKITKENKGSSLYNLESVKFYPSISCSEVQANIRQVCYAWYWKGRDFDRLKHFEVFTSFIIWRESKTQKKELWLFSGAASPKYKCLFV